MCACGQPLCRLDLAPIGRIRQFGCASNWRRTTIGSAQTFPTNLPREPSSRPQKPKRTLSNCHGRTCRRYTSGIGFSIHPPPPSLAAGIGLVAGTYPGATPPPSLVAGILPGPSQTVAPGWAHASLISGGHCRLGRAFTWVCLDYNALAGEIERLVAVNACQGAKVYCM